ncbi:hypothetical protein CWS02_12805 [Enterobacter sp. EA-1]|nr:hypothetical protein CWS02_12805 [Enterobacter sp. EA-1]
MQRQAMGVALHIVLLPFELLHSTIDSYDADLMSRLFLPPRHELLPLRCYLSFMEANMSHLTLVNPADSLPTDPIPVDPVPVPDPIPRPQPLPDPPPDEEPIKLSR